MELSEILPSPPHIAKSSFISKFKSKLKTFTKIFHKVEEMFKDIVRNILFWRELKWILELKWRVSGNHKEPIDQPVSEKKISILK